MFLRINGRNFRIFLNPLFKLESKVSFELVEFVTVERYSKQTRLLVNLIMVFLVLLIMHLFSNMRHHIFCYCQI